MLALVLTLLVAALVVLGGALLQQRERLGSLEQRLVHEKHQREELTLRVERLQAQATGLEDETVESSGVAMLQRPGKQGLKH